MELPKDLPKIYKASFLESTLFAFVSALSLFGEYSQREAIEEYKRYFGLSEDEAPTLSLHQMFYRKREEFMSATEEDTLEAGFEKQRKENDRIYQITKKVINAHNNERDGHRAGESERS